MMFLQKSAKSAEKQSPKLYSAFELLQIPTILALSL